MVNAITWEELTLARFNEAKDKLKQHESRIQQEQIEVDYWKKYVSALEAVLTFAKQQTVNNPTHSEELLTKSTWDNLMIIMKANKGILVVMDAVSFLVEVKFFRDREHARNVIYSTLYAHSRDIQKVRPGVYRLNEIDANKPIVKKFGRHRQKNSENKIIVRKPSLHLKEKLVALININPNITREEALNILIRDGFDFQGRYPKKALAMAWVSLGYAKTNGKPPEQKVNVIEVPDSLAEKIKPQPKFF